MDFPGGASGQETVCQCRVCNRGCIWSVGGKDPLEAIHSSIPAWEIPWTEEPEGLQSTRSQRVRYNLAHTHMQTSLKCLWTNARTCHPGNGNHVHNLKET